MAKKIPEIRFKYFVDEWEIFALEELSDVRDGTHDSPRFVNSGYPLVTSKNVKLGSIDLADIQLISEIDYQKINERSKVNINDILMGMIGTIGNIALIRKEPEFAIKNVALIKDSKIVNQVFLFHFLQAPTLTKQLMEGMEGGTQKFLSLSKIRSLNISICSKNEQKYVGHYFEKLDKLIHLHQKKYDKLVNLKKAMLEKLFPKPGTSTPELRFKGFEGAWEEKRLGEIVDIKSGYSPSIFKDGNIPYVKVDDLNYSERWQYFSRNKVDNQINCNLVFKGSILFPKRGAAILTNKVRIAGLNCIIDTNMMALEPLEVESNFLYLFILKTSLFKIADTSTIPQINNKHIEPYVIKIPSKEEQTQIGNYFQNLDKLISLKQSQLEKLKNIKKACLEKMFV